MKKLRSYATIYDVTANFARGGLFVQSQKTSLKKPILILCFINFISFLTYYFTTYVFHGTVPVYIFYFYTEAARIVLPTAAALIAFVAYAKGSVGRSLLHLLYATLPWLICIFPFYAYEYAYQKLVIEAVMSFATLHTIFMIAILYLESLVLSIVMIAAARIFLKAKRMPSNRHAILSGNDPLDFSAPSAIGIFSGCSVLFLYNLIREIIDTVNFLGYANGFYESAEIIYMVTKYVFILGMLLISYFTSHKLKQKLS